MKKDEKLNSKTRIEWKKYFPENKTPRPQQETIIDFVLDRFINTDKKFVIVSAPTGIGKSFAAITIAKTLESINYSYKHKTFNDYQEGSWILTTQKTLQDQYVKDFGIPKGELCSLKSSFNYECDYFTKNTCQDSIKLLRNSDKTTNFYKSCMYNCKYRIAKKLFLSSSQSLTNFPYFLTYTSFDKENSVKPRKLLILDEAHNLDEVLTSHIEITISESFTEKYLLKQFCDEKTLQSQKKVFNWVLDSYYPRLLEKIKNVIEEMNALNNKNQSDTDEMRRLENHIEKLSSHMDKIEMFFKIYSEDNWTYNIIENEKSGLKIEFKSIDVGKYSEQYLFKYGEKILLMSATILDKNGFCESVGIDPDKADFISVDSDFDHAKSPIIYIPTGKMSKDNIDNTLPVLCSVINDLLDTHKNEKGIIHTHNYKICKYLSDYLSPLNKKRLINHNTDDKSEKVNEFISSKKPLVLISPSSTEGLDLKDDLSRFQIICKIPFPFLGDKLVKLRMNKYKLWYDYQTAKTIIQSRGRSIRNKDDYAITYILDESWEYFFSKNKNLFPDYFKKALKTL